MTRIFYLVFGLISAIPAISRADSEPLILGSGIQIRKTDLVLQIACLEPKQNAPGCTNARFLLHKGNDTMLVGNGFDLAYMIDLVPDEKPAFDSVTVGGAVMFGLAFCSKGEMCPNNLGSRVLLGSVGMVVFSLGPVADVVQLLSLPPLRLIYHRKFVRSIESLTDGAPSAPPRRVSARTVQFFLDLAEGK